MTDEAINSNEIGALIEPDPIAFSFGAPGWYVLLGMVLLLLLIVAIIRYRTYRKNAYRRSAISLLTQLFEGAEEPSKKLFGIAELIKRVSITSYGRNTIVDLSWNDWITFMENKSKGKAAFSSSSIELLSNGLYQGDRLVCAEEDLRRLMNESITWIKQHRV